MLALCSLAELWAQRHSYQYYGPQQGLTNLVIRCLLQDREGYLWVGTDNGVFRYDGNTFQGFYRSDGLPSHAVLDLAESPGGQLWVTTDGGVARRSGSRFVRVEVDGDTPAHYAATRFDNAGRVYVIQRAGLVRAAANGLAFRLVAPGEITGLYINGEEVWFARDGELFRMTPDGRASAVGSAAGLPRDTWTDLTQDASGTFWVRSASRLFSRVKGARAFVDRTAGVAPSSAWMSRLRSSATGQGVMVPTDTGLALVGTPRTEAPVLMDERHGLPADSVRDALETRDGSLWVGTFGGGLVRRLGRGDWVSWRREDGLPHNTVWAIHRDRQQRLWVGSSGGLSLLRADGKVERTWTTRDGLAGNRAEWIVDAPDGGVFVFTQPFGIARFSAGGQLVATYGRAAGLTGNHSALLAVDRDQRLWVTTHDVCFRSTAPLDGRTPPRFEKVNVPLLSANAKFTGSITVDTQGAVWLGSTEGLLRMAGGQWRSWRTRDGLLADAVAGVTEQDGAYWIRYVDSLGLTRLDLNGKSVRHFSHQNGLTSDAIFGTAIDRRHRLWVSTDNGVDLFDGSRWRHFGVGDGLISSDCNDGALLADGDNVWVGTSNGLSRYSIAASPAEAPARPVLFSIEGESRRWLPGEQPVLPYSQRSFRIRFGSLHFASENKLRFRFRLAGEDGVWSETSDRSVYYAGLPAGDHTFELAAAGEAGLWNEPPVRLGFRILAPWWQTWWFFAGSVLACALMIAMIWKIRVRRLMAQKAALEEQVASRTAELRESNRKLEEIAFVDSLTLLANRRMFARELDRRIAHASRYGGQFGLLLIDLDRFKPINDTYGHDAGDAVLAETASRLRAALREDDCVARLGGDEFAVLFTLAEPETDVNAFCSRLARVIDEKIPFQDHLLQVGMSAGASLYPEHGLTADGLYKMADLALYQAKRRTCGNCWTIAGQSRWESQQALQ